MNVTIKEKEYFVDPILSLSSLKPDANNDLTAWESEDQKVLAYNDIICLAIDDERYYEREYTLYFTSSQIKLNDIIGSESFLLKIDSAQKIWSGNLFLTEEILLVGETSSGGYKIYVGTNSLKLEIFTNFKCTNPYILINIETLYNL